MLVKLACVGVAAGLYVLSTQFPAVADELKILVGVVLGTALPEAGRKRKDA